MTPAEREAALQAELATLAAGTLQEWFDNYTPPLDLTRCQAKVVHHDYDDAGLTFELRHAPDFLPDPRRYRVSVTLERIA